MATIHEETVTIKFSKLVKNSEAGASEILASDIQQTLEQVAQELVGDSVIVEAEKH